MQLINIAPFVALIVGVAAMPNKPPPPPKPSAPAAGGQTTTISCSGGSPYCCSPDNTGGGYTCEAGVTQCSSIAICCNNVGNADSAAAQSCIANTVQSPFTIVFA